MGDLAAIVACVVLTVIAGIHIYWGLGGRWPGTDEETLARKVVGGSRMPGLVPCFVVAVLLFASGGLLAVARGWITLEPAWWISVGPWVVVGVLACRGVGGFFAYRIRPELRGTPFESLNLRIYSPLCVVLAGLCTASLLL